jgi:hypothetical protein
VSNEDGYFEIYWALRGQKSWDRTRLPSDPVKPPAGWGFGFKDAAKDAWMARASLHITQANTDSVPVSSKSASATDGEVNG